MVSAGKFLVHRLVKKNLKKIGGVGGTPNLTRSQRCSTQIFSAKLRTAACFGCLVYIGMHNVLTCAWLLMAIQKIERGKRGRRRRGRDGGGGGEAP